jgi:hypothetical protein
MHSRKKREIEEGKGERQGNGRRDDGEWETGKKRKSNY